jgi:hypothetical protein
MDELGRMVRKGLSPPARKQGTWIRKGRFSDEYVKFVTDCLEVDPAERPGANELLCYSFFETLPMAKLMNQGFIAIFTHPLMARAQEMIGMIYVKENLISTEMMLEMKMLYTSINDDKPFDASNRRFHDWLNNRTHLTTKNLLSVERQFKRSGPLTIDFFLHRLGFYEFTIMGDKTAKVFCEGFQEHEFVLPSRVRELFLTHCRPKFSDKEIEKALDQIFIGRESLKFKEFMEACTNVEVEMSPASSKLTNTGSVLHNVNQTGSVVVARKIAKLKKAGQMKSMKESTLDRLALVVEEVESPPPLKMDIKPERKKVKRQLVLNEKDEDSDSYA